MKPKETKIAAEETGKVLDFDEIIIKGNNLHNAIKGVEKFIQENVSSGKVALESIDILNGLIASLISLSSEHVSDVDQYEKQMWE